MSGIVDDPAPQFPDVLGATLRGAADEALAGRSNGPSGVEASVELSRALGRPVVGALLFGSRARREATPSSDFDALVLTDGGPRGGLRGTSAGMDLDIEVVPVTLAESAAPDDWIHLAGGVPLHDPAGAVARLLARVNELHARGPSPMKLDDVTRYRVWARRMCNRIARHLGTDPTLAAYQSAWLLTTLLDLYFQIRSLWTRSAREALRYWKHEDPHHREAWDAYAAERDPRERLSILERIVASTFDGAGS